MVKKTSLEVLAKELFASLYRKAEDRTLARRALDAELPVMPLCDVFYYRKPESRAAELAAPGLVYPVEALEYARYIRRRDADAGIHDITRHEAIFPGRAHDDAPAGRGVLDCGVG